MYTYDFIQQHGVKGQKWGVRRKRNRDIRKLSRTLRKQGKTYTEEQRRAYRDMDALDGNKLSAKEKNTLKNMYKKQAVKVSGESVTTANNHRFAKSVRTYYDMQREQNGLRTHEENETSRLLLDKKLDDKKVDKNFYKSNSEKAKELFKLNNAIYNAAFNKINDKYYHEWDWQDEIEDPELTSFKSTNKVDVAGQATRARFNDAMYVSGLSKKQKRTWIENYDPKKR